MTAKRSQNQETLALGGSKAAGLGVLGAGKTHLRFGFAVGALAGAVVDHAVFIALDGGEVGAGERIHRGVAIHRAAIVAAGRQCGRGGSGGDGNGGGRGFGGGWGQRNRWPRGRQGWPGRAGGRGPRGCGRGGRIGGQWRKHSGEEINQRGRWLGQGRRGDRCRAGIAGFAGGNGRGEGLGIGRGGFVFGGDGSHTGKENTRANEHFNEKRQFNFGRHDRIVKPN